MQVSLRSHRESMAINMGEQMGAGMTFMPGLIFVFGGSMLSTDSTGHLGQFDNLAPG